MILVEDIIGRALSWISRRKMYWVGTLLQDGAAFDLDTSRRIIKMLLMRRAILDTLVMNVFLEMTITQLLLYNRENVSDWGPHVSKDLVVILADYVMLNNSILSAIADCVIIMNLRMYCFIPPFCDAHARLIGYCLCAPTVPGALQLH
jgi:hypothetical protein